MFTDLNFHNCRKLGWRGRPDSYLLANAEIQKVTALSIGKLSSCQNIQSKHLKSNSKILRQSKKCCSSVNLNHQWKFCWFVCTMKSRFINTYQFKNLIFPSLVKCLLYKPTFPTMHTIVSCIRTSKITPLFLADLFKNYRQRCLTDLKKKSQKC